METNEVLDTSVIIEGRTGLMTVFSGIEYPPALEKCTILWPNRTDFSTALELSLQLRLHGTPVGCTDLLIASMCINRQLTLVTTDHDFAAIAKVAPQFSLRLF